MFFILACHQSASTVEDHSWKKTIAAALEWNFVFKEKTNRQTASN